MNENSVIEVCSDISRRVRQSILEMTFSTGSNGAHLGGSLSIVELLVGLYFGCIRYHTNDPQWEGRDRVILSKGHAAMAWYAVLAEKGIFPRKELETFKKDGSRLTGHPSLNGLPGVEFASGSLGQGLSLGVGVCLALLRKGNVESRVFVFLGDGECDEGSVWEAAASASHFGLSNIVAVIDANGLQYDGSTTEVMNMSPMADKWRAFGWNVVVINGHDIEEILKAYNVKTGKPLLILANTIKGKGVSFMENNPKYHNATLSKEQYASAVSELRI